MAVNEENSKSMAETNQLVSTKPQNAARTVYKMLGIKLLLVFPVSRTFKDTETSNKTKRINKKRI